MDMALNILQTN